MSWQTCCEKRHEAKDRLGVLSVASEKNQVGGAVEKACQEDFDVYNYQIMGNGTADRAARKLVIIITGEPRPCCRS